MEHRGDFIDLAPTEHVDAHITRLKRRASKLVANNQQACYPVLVEQQRKWWKRYKREHKRWAYICVDRGHKRHDLFISSNGRIGTGKLYPNPSGVSIAYVRIDESLWHQGNMEIVIARLSNELPKRLSPAKCTG